MPELSPENIAEVELSPTELEGGVSRGEDSRPEGLPYPGLRAFRPDETDIFFGREAALDAMAERLGQTSFLAVLGPSGCGKSSLVRTGLYTTLRLGLLPNAGGRWRIAEANPGRRPIWNLARALLKARADHPDDWDPEAEAVDQIAEHLRRGPRSVVEFSEDGVLDDGRNLLLVIDQFEELFRFRDYAGREEAEAFASLLLESARSPLPIHVVITMRSEYLGACSLMPGLAEQISEGMFLTPRMTREECRQAIEGPARVRGFEIEPELVARILNDLQTFAPFDRADGLDQAERLALQADQLPLMQHLLNRMWRRAQAGDRQGRLVLVLHDYDGAGGLTGALDEHGDEVVAALVAEAGEGIRTTVERVFRALVDGPSIPLAVRCPQSVRNLVAAAGGEDKRAEVALIVNAFRSPDCNFLRTSEAALDDEVVVDIGHESLIRRWSDLRRWFEDEVAARIAWQRLAADAALAKSGEGLLREAGLRRAAEWWDRERPTPYLATRYGGDFDGARSFLQASGEADARRRRNEKRRFYATRIGGGVIVALLAVIVYVSIQARDARERYEETSQLYAGATRLYAEATGQISRTTIEALAIRKYFSDRLCASAPESSAQNSECVGAAIQLIQRNYLSTIYAADGRLPSMGGGPAGGVIGQGQPPAPGGVPGAGAGR